MGKTFLLCIASLIAASGLRAQYRVTVTHPDTVGIMRMSSLLSIVMGTFVRQRD